jgi:hypothetical integral membrane protein (TIGR02206 family)
LTDTLFLRFGPDHDLALLVILVAGATSIVFVRLAPPSATKRFRLALAAAMVGGALTEILLALWEGSEPLSQVAPLELCDLSLMLGVFTLITLSRRTVEPLYYFVMSGTVAALLTPELPAVGATDFRFLAYFGLHGLTVIATLTLTLGLGLVPALGAWWRAMLWLNAYAALVSVVNIVAGTNFMYLRAKPVVPTLFDWLGPWPWYLLSLEGVGLVLFFLLDLPLRALARPVTNGNRARRTTSGS